MRVHFTSDALADLEDIGDFIAEDNPIRADSFVAELHDKARSIGRLPRAHPLRSDLAPGLRAAVHRSYLIFFRINRNHVEILRIVHGARNLGRLFRAE
jgi:toxin ParE1/3/4